MCWNTWTSLSIREVWETVRPGGAVGTLTGSERISRPSCIIGQKDHRYDRGGELLRRAAWHAFMSVLHSYPTFRR